LYRFHVSSVSQWRILHNEELRDLYFPTQYFSGNKIEMNEMGGACSTYGREESFIHRVLMGNPEGKRQLGRPRRRWESTKKIQILQK
jgi:hypothetical protein